MATKNIANNLTSSTTYLFLDECSHMATPMRKVMMTNSFNCVMALPTKNILLLLIILYIVYILNSVLSEHKTSLACDHHDDLPARQSQPFYSLHSAK